MAYEEMAQNVRIDFIQELKGTMGDTIYASIKISNSNEAKLPSHLSEGIYLSYHLYKDNELLEWDGLRTPIEVDVFGEYVQDIKVELPDSAGAYEIVPDIVLEGRAWFNLNQRFAFQQD